MIESTRTPRICFEAEGVPCQGGCHFLIIPGRRIWPDDLCDTCEQHHNGGDHD